MTNTDSTRLDDDLEFSCDCGGEVKKIEANGRFFSMNEYGQMRLTKYKMVMTCEKCGDYYENGGDHSISDGLFESLTDNFIEITKLIKEKHNIDDRTMAHFCGVTKTSFSRYKNRDYKKVPSSAIFLLLKELLRNGPEFRTKIFDYKWE